MRAFRGPALTSAAVWFLFQQWSRNCSARHSCPQDRTLDCRAECCRAISGCREGCSVVCAEHPVSPPVSVWPGPFIPPLAQGDVSMNGCDARAIVSARWAASHGDGCRLATSALIELDQWRAPWQISRELPGGLVESALQTSPHSFHSSRISPHHLTQVHNGPVFSPSTWFDFIKQIK